MQQATPRKGGRVACEHADAICITARGRVCITVTVTAAAAATHPSFHSTDSESTLSLTLI